MEEWSDKLEKKIRLRTQELEKDKRFSKKEIIHRRIKQLFVIPIIIEGEVKRIINLENTSLATNTINLLKSFSEQAAVTINNARLYQKSRIVILK